MKDSSSRSFLQPTVTYCLLGRNITNLLNCTVFTQHTNNSCKIYDWLIKQHVSALFGHHQAYKEIVLIKVHSLINEC